MLVWTVENPTNTTIEPGIGRVRPRGSQQVTPAATTTYTLTATGPNNTTLTRSVTVNVAGTAPVTAAGAAATKKEVPRMPDGKPNLTGVYNGGGGRDAVTPELKAGAEKFKVVRGPDDAGLYANCMPTGVPQAFSVPYQWEIVQGLDRVVILHEYPHLFRVIPTNGVPHPVDPDPTWMGDSAGRWEGDTLVVDTVGFNDKTWLDMDGHPHTEMLHVTERFHRRDLGHMDGEMTVEDLGALAKPWIVKRAWALDPKEEIRELLCTENERDAVHLK
jgi:hypothetical protein